MTPRQTAGFFALCFLSSAVWLTTDFLPSTLNPIAGEGFRLLLVGTIGLLLYLPIRRSGTYTSLARCILISAAGLGLVGIPFLLLVAAEGKIASTSIVLVFAGMPILLIVAGASSSSESGLRLLPAGLMGIAGLLILLPLTVPRGGAGMLGLGMVLLAMGCTAAGGVWLHRLLGAFPITAAISLAGFTNGIVLIVAASTLTAQHWDVPGIGMEALRGLLFDLPQVLLLLWLTKSITPLRLAVRYIVAPLLTVVEGLFLLHPRFEGRTLFGLIVLSCAAYLMLRSNRMDRDVSLKLG